MKNILLSLLAAVSCGSLTVSALDAKFVRVIFEADDATPQTIKAEALSAPGGSGFIPTKPVLKASTVPWQVVNIPVTLEAVGPKNDKGKEDKPQFISRIDFHVYLAFKTDAKEKGGKEPKPVLLDKEVSYVNIPVHPGTGADSTCQNKMYVGVFISPSDAVRIKTEGKDRGVLDKSLMAVAVEASFNGANCMASKVKGKEKKRSKILDPSNNKYFKDLWWRMKGETNGVELLTIAETPYAPFFAPFYPAVTPMFGPAYQVPAGVSAMGNVAPTPGAPGASATSGVSGTYGASGMSGTETDATGGSSADETPADSSAETTDTPSRASRSRGRSRFGRGSRGSSSSF